MEILSKLEEAIFGLAEEIKGLRAENTTLRSELEIANSIIAENEKIEAQLRDKEALINATSQRIEELLSTVRSELSSSSENS